MAFWEADACIRLLSPRDLWLGKFERRVGVPFGRMPTIMRPHHLWIHTQILIANVDADLQIGLHPYGNLIASKNRIKTLRFFPTATPTGVSCALLPSRYHTQYMRNAVCSVSSAWLLPR